MLNNLVRRVGLPSTLLFAASTAMLSHADDTELYSASYEAGATGKPKVLVVFDDSGSMDEIVYGGKPDYDPNASYVNKVPGNRIYWSKTGSPPNVNGSAANQWFPESANSCGQSFSPLDQFGFYSSPAQRWQVANGQWVTETIQICDWWFFGFCFRSHTEEQTRWDGTSAGWEDLSGNVNNPYSVDCSEDISASNNTNASGIGNGYPREATAPDTANAAAYVGQRNQSNVNYGNGAYQFYTSHYMDWYYDTSIVTEDKDYLQIAQEVIENIVQTNPGVDFGLAVFNDNNSSNGNDDGGRIVKRIIQNMSQTNRDELVTTLWGFDHRGNTPLCETGWESYLYMTGGRRKYGISGDSRDLPLRDTQAEDGSGNYVSPLEECANTYIIFMTDGLPTSDTDANQLVKNLTGRNNCPTYSSGGSSFSSCLAPLTEYMAENDLDGDADNGNQSVLTATVGFNVDSRATEFLTDVATLTNEDGDPAYYYAESADELTSSFNQIILGILAKESTFTSPAVAVDSFTRTESREDVFYAMFQPKATKDWLGNIKKYKLGYVNGAIDIIDANNNAAYDNNREIKDSARSFWSAGNDGAEVAAGGVGALLRNRNLSDRNILTNTGASGALEAFTTANITAGDYGLANASELYAFWQVTNASDFDKTIRWGRGYDVDDKDGDGQTGDTRQWIMADILHSQPVVINYGALGDFTTANPDLRIVAGTNNGMLHFFGNDDGQEDWAFFPKELGPVLSQRRKNSGNTKNVYGVDAPVRVYTEDLNRDGTLDADAGDKVYLYFGLRRGGKLMYAMDISDPDSPRMMWSLSPGNLGMSELGQTWSVPSVTKIPGYKDGNGKAKPVLIFGAGYDPAKDDHATLADTGVQDSTGRGMFIVDALTGNLVWSVTPAANSARNMQATELVHSIAADVKVIDSNGDQITDRVYLADTGGNVWRVDMPGNTLPDSSQATWFISQLFDANGGTKATDRRFFSEPDVVRTLYKGEAIDVVLIGSGDRTNPIAKDNPNDVNDPAVDNQFYMIRDKRTRVYTAALDPDDCDDDPVGDFRCDLPLEPDDLYDITSNVIASGTTEERAAALEALAEADGWRLDLVDDGEKSLSASITLSGKVFFTTFSPVVDLVGCGFSAGTGYLYAIDLFTGVGVPDPEDRRYTPGDLIFQTPSPFYPPPKPPCEEEDCEDEPDERETMLLLPDGPHSSGTSLDGPYGSFWHREDY